MATSSPSDHGSSSSFSPDWEKLSTLNLASSPSSSDDDLEKLSALRLSPSSSSDDDWEKISALPFSPSSSSSSNDEGWLIVKTTKQPTTKKRKLEENDHDHHNTDTDQIESSGSIIFMQEVLYTYLPELAANPAITLEYIEQNYFPQLPAKPLLRLRRTSQRWDRWISSPFFIHTHSLTWRSLAGFFFNDINGDPCFSPLAGEPTITLPPFPEPVIAKASNHGLLCLLGKETRSYYICNPTTASYAVLPPSAVDHGEHPAVVIVMKEPLTFNFDSDYYLVCAHEIFEGVYGFETFDSENWGWRASNEIAAAEWVVSGSGVGVSGKACWRTTMRNVVVYDPVLDSAGERFFYEGGNWDWEIGELGGKLCVVSERVGGVGVWVRSEGVGGWVKVGEVEGLVEAAVRGEGMREVAVWDEGRRTVRVRDVERGMERELAEEGNPGYCTDFLPYISTLVNVKRYVIVESCTI